VLAVLAAKALAEGVPVAAGRERGVVWAHSSSSYDSASIVLPSAATGSGAGRIIAAE
jgi:hypothetical protein